MKKYNIYPYRTDLKLKEENVIGDNQIKIIENIISNKIYKTIIFNDNITKDKIKDILTKELIFFYKKMHALIYKNFLIIGIGNDNYTSDSIGPKTLKSIKVNYLLDNMKKPSIKVSAIEPGALGETGILTEKIISSITKEIKPDIIILIDSYVTDNINYLNKSIEINNRGLYSGCGISNINSQLDEEQLGVPIIAIGVPTAIEVKFTNNNKTNFKPYLLSTKDVDKYINIISKVIGESINSSINYLLQYQGNND